MTNESDNNKRIAKNTIYMYLRMLITMFVSLYTSRIVLQTLGVEDFGIYNIVGGVVVLFTFINSAMASGTQRHLSYELGKGEIGNMTEVFSACMHIHLLLSLIVLILAETIGLWFLNTQMNFPIQRMDAVNWVYQFSILGCIASIIRVPYQASIIAYEHMSFYAYIGIIEAGLKLLIVYLLLIFSTDKLILYSVLMFVIIFLTTVWFASFCRYKFKLIRFKRVKDKNLYKQLISFSGWAMFGSVANLGLQQGLNIIINIFYGVKLNAAVGIANQVNAAVMNFVSGFQQALNPQLVKSQADGNRERQFQLIFESSKLSFFIMFVIAFPLLVNLDYVLDLWLGYYPPYTTSICRLIIIGALIECLSGPLWVTIFATGNIRVYQIIISALLLLNVPISYIGGRLGFSAEAMFLVRNIIYVFAFTIRLVFLKRMILLDISLFAKQVIVPIIKVLCLVVLPVSILMHSVVSPSSNFISLLWQTVAICIFELLVVYSFGLQAGERIYVLKLIRKRFNR